MENKSKLTCTVNVRLEEALEKDLPEVVVYAFDERGQFLTSEPLPKGRQGLVKLELPSKLTGSTVRVALGPPQAEEMEEMPPWMAKMVRRGEVRKEAPTLASIYRRGGREKRFRLPAEGGKIDMTVVSVDWRRWLFCSCIVRGRLVKRIPLPDGMTKELGVCHACVKIYEVDKIPKIIMKLPDRDIFRLRDDLWRIRKKYLFGPLVISTPQTPFPEVMGGTVIPTTVAALEDSLLRSVSTPVITSKSPESQSVLKAESMLLGNQLGAEFEPIFRAASASQLRSALIANAELLAYYVWDVEWLRSWFNKDLLKCACTDEQGRFETTISYPCAGDKPDLYFKAVQCIGGTLHTLYDPGMVHHTHWNYACGSEVILETDDTAAITCVPPISVDTPPGVSVWVMPHAIGGIRLDQIKPSGLTDFVHDKDDDNGTWVDVPFGDTLGFSLGYSSDIPYKVAGKPAYYRWLYKKLDSNGNETEWKEFDATVAETVVRHYIDYDLAHPDLPPTFPAYTLGPTELNGMHVYEFKPHEPPKAPLGHEREWPVDGWFADLYSGILNSVKLPGGVASAAGKYKIKLEVYDKEDGKKITPDAGTFDFIVPIGLEADGVTIRTRKAYSSEIDEGGFVFYLHVDNNKCEAEIYEASVNGAPAGGCGFISYGPGDDVHLSFKAKHPNGFARFKFTVVRGSSGYVSKACAPDDPNNVAWANAPLVTDTPVNGFKRDASSVFAKDVDESDMRGGCPKAAFGENLYVKATATNGWVRLSGLDAYALPKAFALEPKTAGNEEL